MSKPVPGWFLALAAVVAVTQYIIRRVRKLPPVNEYPEVPDE